MFWYLIRSRTRQNFELVHIIGPVQNFGPPARNFGPLRSEFAWREWRKTLGGHVANWAGLSGFSPRENKISHTFFIDCINKYSKVSNAHNFDEWIQRQWRHVDMYVRKGLVSMQNCLNSTTNPTILGVKKTLFIADYSLLVALIKLRFWCFSLEKMYFFYFHFNQFKVKFWWELQHFCIENHFICT